MRRSPVASLVGHLGLRQSIPGRQVARLPRSAHGKPDPGPSNPVGPAHTGSYFVMISAGAGPGRVVIGLARKVSASYRATYPENCAFLNFRPRRVASRTAGVCSLPSSAGGVGCG